MKKLKQIFKLKFSLCYLIKYEPITYPSIKFVLMKEINEHLHEEYYKNEFKTYFYHNNLDSNLTSGKLFIPMN